MTTNLRFHTKYYPPFFILNNIKTDWQFSVIIENLTFTFNPEKINAFKYQFNV